jgi:hypothetical protein
MGIHDPGHLASRYGHLERTMEQLNATLAVEDSSSGAPDVEGSIGG